MSDLSDLRTALNTPLGSPEREALREKWAGRCQWGLAGLPACRAGTRDPRYWCDVCAEADRG